MKKRKKKPICKIRENDIIVLFEHVLSWLMTKKYHKDDIILKLKWQHSKLSLPLMTAVNLILECPKKKNGKGGSQGFFVAWWNKKTLVKVGITQKISLSYVLCIPQFANFFFFLVIETCYFISATFYLFLFPSPLPQPTLLFG